MRSAFLKFASLLLILALVSAGLFACDKEEPPVDDEPETVDSGEDSESESDGGSESEEDTDGDEIDEPKSEIFEDVSGKSIYLINLTGSAMNAITEYSYDELGRLVSLRHLDSFALRVSDALRNATCSYTYGEDGLESLCYYGIDVVLERSADGKAFGSAEQSELKMIFELEFFDDGRISSETVRIEGTEGILISTYDEKGRPTGEVNENSAGFSYSYGEESVTSVYILDGKTMSTSEYFFGDNGRIEKLISRGDEGAEIISDWSYDEEGNCVGYLNSSKSYVQKMSFGYTGEYLTSFDYYAGMSENELSPMMLGARIFSDSGIIVFESTTLYTQGVKTREDLNYDGTGKPLYYTDYTFHQNGEVETKNVYSYNGEGKVVRLEGFSYNSSGELRKKSNIEYGETKITERVEEYENGVNFSSFENITEYDSQGREIKKTTRTYTESVLTQTAVYQCEYNGSGLLVKERFTAHDGKGAFVLDETCEYIYDENGKRVKSIVTAYDEEGKIISRSE